MNKSKTFMVFVIIILISSLLISFFPGMLAITTVKPPKVIPNAPSSLKLAEDAPPDYLDLYDIYDGSGGALNFTLWTGAKWGQIFKNNNISVAIKANDTLEFSPKPNMYGSDKITISATNSAGSTNHIITVTIKPTNDPPVIELIGNIKVTDTTYASIFMYQNEWYNVTVTASDIDGDKIIFLDNTSLFDIDYLTGNISFKATQDDVGIHYINITVSDINGTKFEDWVNIKFTVLNVNDPPIASIIYPENGTVVYNEKYMVFEGKGFDPDMPFGDSLKYFWYSDIDGELGFGEKIEIYYLSVGTHEITLNVTDSMGLFDEEIITLIVESGYRDQYYNIELEMEPNYVILKENEKVSTQVTVYNYGRQTDNITFGIEKHLNFPGEVELEFENITLYPRRSSDFTITISVPSGTKIGMYIVELTTESSLKDDSDPNNTGNYDDFGYEDSENIRVYVISNNSDDLNKYTNKPTWEAGFEWEYILNTSLYEAYDLNGTMDLKISDNTTIKVDAKDYDVYKMDMTSELEMSIDQTIDPFFSNMDLKINGTNYYQTSNLATVKYHINSEYTMNMLGEKMVYGTEIKTTYDPPAIEIDFPLTPGKQWNVKTTASQETKDIEKNPNYGISDSGKYKTVEKQIRSYLCLGTELVSVPVGTFETYLITELYRDSDTIYDDWENGIDYRGSRSRLIDFDTYGYDEFHIDHYSPEVRQIIKQVSYSMSYNYDYDYYYENITWEQQPVLELISYSLEIKKPDSKPINVSNTDSDDDTLPDSWEDEFGVDDPLSDNDGDGFTNAEEFENGTHPMNANDNPENPVDKDKDGMPDTWELYHGLDPTNPLDAAGDLDADGFPNRDEYDSRTSPNDPTDHPTVIEDDNENISSLIFIYVFVTIGVIFLLIIFTLAAHRRRKRGKEKTQLPTQHDAEAESRVSQAAPPEAAADHAYPTIQGPNTGHGQDIYRNRQEPDYDYPRQQQYNPPSPLTSPSPPPTPPSSQHNSTTPSTNTQQYSGDIYRSSGSNYQNDSQENYYRKYWNDRNY